MHVSFVDFCLIVRINASLLNAPLSVNALAKAPKIEQTTRVSIRSFVTNIKYPENISLRSWRYCVIKVLAAEQRSKKGSGWYSGFAAESHSTSTQYCHTILPATQAKRK